MWERLQQADKPVVLYGMGRGADRVREELQRRQIPVAGVFANDEFVRGQSYAGFPVLRYQQARERWGEMIVLLCFGTHSPAVMEQICAIDREQELYAPDFPIAGEGLFDADYVSAQHRRLEELEELLADEESRMTLRCLLEYKRSGKIAPLLRCQRPAEESWRLLQPGLQEAYLDLGAYDGDSIDTFLQIAGGTYQQIYAVEPDEVSFRKLRQHTAGLPRCQLFPVGIHDRWDRLPFAGGSGRGSALGAGKLQQVDSVDNLLCARPVTLIKMDVEGQEAAAIRGAARTIQKQRPRMLVAAYHRREDLVELPFQVLALRSDYRVYLRHSPCLPAWEVNYCFI